MLSVLKDYNRVDKILKNTPTARQTLFVFKQAAGGIFFV